MLKYMEQQYVYQDKYLIELIKGFVLLLWKSDSRKKEKEKAVYIQRCVKYHSFTWTEIQQESMLFFLLQIS